MYFAETGNEQKVELTVALRSCMTSLCLHCEENGLVCSSPAAARSLHVQTSRWLYFVWRMEQSHLLCRHTF